jgi:hypothetical protein
MDQSIENPLQVPIQKSMQESQQIQNNSNIQSSNIQQ